MCTMVAPLSASYLCTSASSGSSLKLMGESDEVDTEELRVGGDRDGVLDGARDEGVGYARSLCGPMAYELKVVGESY